MIRLWPCYTIFGLKTFGEQQELTEVMRLNKYPAVKDLISGISPPHISAHLRAFSVQGLTFYACMLATTKDPTALWAERNFTIDCSALRSKAFCNCGKSDHVQTMVKCIVLHACKVIKVLMMFFSTIAAMFRWILRQENDYPVTE